jgi:hypothetical protein
VPAAGVEAGLHQGRREPDRATARAALRVGEDLSVALPRRALAVGREPVSAPATPITRIAVSPVTLPALTRATLIRPALAWPAVVVSALAEPAVVVSALAWPAVVVSALAWPAVVVSALARPEVAGPTVVPVLPKPTAGGPAVVVSGLARPALAGSVLAAPAVGRPGRSLHPIAAPAVTRAGKSLDPVAGATPTRAALAGSALVRAALDTLPWPLVAPAAPVVVGVAPAAPVVVGVAAPVGFVLDRAAFEQGPVAAAGDEAGSGVALVVAVGPVAVAPLGRRGYPGLSAVGVVAIGRRRSRLLVLGGAAPFDPLDFLFVDALFGCHPSPRHGGNGGPGRVVLAAALLRPFVLTVHRVHCSSGLLDRHPREFARAFTRITSRRDGWPRKGADGHAGGG